MFFIYLFIVSLSVDILVVLKSSKPNNSLPLRMPKTAIIIGGTGLTGSLVLKILLNDERYDCVKLFSRNSVGQKHPKLKEFLVDVLGLESVKSDFTADEVYCCIGTTKKKTPDKDLYTRIDFGIPAKAAKLCAENGVHTMSVISAIGADSKSKIFYITISLTFSEPV